MPSPTPTEFDSDRIRSFVASVEGQDALLGAIASGFGHADPTLFVTAARREVAGWSDSKRGNVRVKILTGQIDVIGGHGELKGSVKSIASALLGFRTPPGRALEIGKVLFAILDADVDDLGAWMRDVPPCLVSMGCNRERLALYVIGRLPS
ncbi:MAG: hypothetical protein WCO25_00960 [Candidatus Uhrbacteria bacterium]